MSMSMLLVRRLILNSFTDTIDWLPDLFLALLCEMRGWSWNSQLLPRWRVHIALWDAYFYFTTNIADLIHPDRAPKSCLASIIAAVWRDRSLAAINRSLNSRWLLVLVLLSVRLHSLDDGRIIIIGMIRRLQDQTLYDVDSCQWWLTCLSYYNYLLITYLGNAMIRSKGPEIAYWSSIAAS